MLKVFRDLRWAYYALAMMGGLILVLVLITISVPETLGVILVVAWIFLCFGLFNSKANNRGKALDQMRSGCRVRPYVDSYAELLPKQREGSVGDSVVKLNLATGLLDLGELDSAIDFLSRVKIPGRVNSNSIGLASAYHSSFCMAFIKKGDFASARQALNALKRIYETEKLAVPSKEVLEGLIKLREAQIDIASCNTDRLNAAEDSLREFLDKATKDIEKVGARYYLARLAYIRGDRQKEYDNLTYVAAQGGDTNYAADARSILENFGPMEPESDTGADTDIDMNTDAGDMGTEYLPVEPESDTDIDESI